MSAVKIPYRRPVRSGNNSTAGEKFAENVRYGLGQFFGGRRVIRIAGFLAVLILIAAGAFWYLNIYASPSRTFWDMVGNNLSTYSVSMESGQSAKTGTSSEYSQLAFGQSPMVRNIKEVDSISSGFSAKIKIESIGTPTDTYQHYVLIDQPAGKGKAKADYSKVYPLWVKNGGNGQAGNSSLFNNVIFSGFLFGNLPSAQKSTLKNYLSSAYSVDFTNVKKQKIHSRKTYTYNVIVSLKDYAKAAQYYAQSLKLPIAGQINPDSYQPSDQFSASVEVDVLSRQLRQVVYKSSNSTENYSGYGILASYKLPLHTVNYSTLQSAVVKASNPTKK